MNPIRRIKNVTFRRLALDLYQFIRAQRPAVKIWGRQFECSRNYIEIDVTYKCNLKCLNCNRSCTQLPSNEEMNPDRIAAFLEESIAGDMKWERIRILGGEPTLHSRIFDIIDMLLDYRKRFNPEVRIVLCTNAFGRQVWAVLSKIPREIEIKSAIKTSRKNLFRAFNIAPVDGFYNRLSDFSCGCRILSDCGMGLTPSGYYACAIAGGIDRVFRFGMGRKTVPAQTDSMLDQLNVFCRLCGHFGFGWPVKKQVSSVTWQRAYEQRAPAPTDSLPISRGRPGSIDIHVKRHNSTFNHKYKRLEDSIHGR